MISPQEPGLPGELQSSPDASWRMEDWAINTYTCIQGHMTTTVEVEAGTTPAQIECPHCLKAGLKGQLAISAMYPSERPYPFVYPAITHEWYRMNRNKAESQGAAAKYHHDNGGLFMRKRTKKQPIPNTYG